MMVFGHCLRGYAVLLITAFLALPPVSAQQDARTVRIVVPAPAGGSLDGTARILAQRLTALTGEAYVIENKPGANTLIGVEHVVRAMPDGRTLLYAGTSLVINALLQKLSFVPLEDLRPVMAVGVERYALISTTQLQATSAKALDALATARAGGLNCAASPGPMSLGCEQLRGRVKGAMTSVPYPGIAPALTALAGGHVDVTFVAVEAARSLVDANLAQILAVSHRVASGRDGLDASAPLLSDIWPGFVMDNLAGIYVPARTPEDRVRQLNRDLAQVLSEPESRRRMQVAGQDPVAPDSPEHFARAMAALSARYSQVINVLGLRVP